MTPEKKVELTDWIIAMLIEAKDRLRALEMWYPKDDDLHREAVSWLNSLNE